MPLAAGGCGQQGGGQSMYLLQGHLAGGGRGGHNESII